MGPLLPETVVLVTGSTTGIGEAIARRAVEEGARVMIHGRSDERAREISEDLGADARHVTADLQDPDAPEQIVDATVEAFGRIDALVNNAATTERSNVETTDADTFDRIVAINLRAPLLLVRATIPHFREQGGGEVLNVGSVNALGGEPNLLAYSVSKGGLMTMTRNLADAHKTDQIRFNQLNVGWTLTENEDRIQREMGMSENWVEELPPAFAPSGRIFSPREVAAHAVFWLSEETGPVSGAVYEVEQSPMIGSNPDKQD